jgi:DNA-binding transcriptional MerR regulator
VPPSSGKTPTVESPPGGRRNRPPGGLSTEDGVHLADSRRNGAQEEEWTVGELAAELEVTPRTLRFYEAEGLLAPVRKPNGRRYTRRDRTRMQLILRGKRFGMSLTEIREILDMYDGASGAQIRQLERLVDRIAEISADLTVKQQDIASTLDELADVSQQCRAKLDQLRKPSQSRRRA